MAYRYEWYHIGILKRGVSEKLVPKVPVPGSHVILACPCVITTSFFDACRQWSVHRFELKIPTPKSKFCEFWIYRGMHSPLMHVDTFLRLFSSFFTKRNPRIFRKIEMASAARQTASISIQNQIHSAVRWHNAASPRQISRKKYFMTSISSIKKFFVTSIEEFFLVKWTCCVLSSDGSIASKRKHINNRWWYHWKARVLLIVF